VDRAGQPETAQPVFLRLETGKPDFAFELPRLLLANPAKEVRESMVQIAQRLLRASPKL
jgi:hypothetical protein